MVKPVRPEPPGRADGPAPDRLVVAAGTLIVSAFCAVAWLRPAFGAPVFIAALLVATIGYLAAMGRLARRPSLSRRTLLTCLALSLAWRAALLTVPAVPSSDAIRYVWDARVQRAGLDPYRSRPSDEALAWIHTDITRTVDAATLPTIYPPVAQLYFRAVTSVNESVWAFRVAAVAGDVLTALTLMRVLALLGRPLEWVLLYAWHPLPAIEGAIGGHVDFAGVPLLTMSWLAMLGQRTAVGMTLFALAVLVKPLPLVLAPLFWRRVRARDAALAAAVAAGAIVVVTGGRLPLGSLGTFVDRFRFNSPLFAALEAIAEPRALAACAVAIGLIVATGFRARNVLSAPEAWCWPMAATLLVAPVIYPWYLMWLTPFLAGRSSSPLFVWTLSVLSVYPAWHFVAPDAPWAVPAPLVAVELGPPLAVVGLLVWQRRRSSRMQNAPQLVVKSPTDRVSVDSV